MTDTAIKHPRARAHDGAAASVPISAATPRLGFIRRHPVRSGIVAGLVLLLLVLALVGSDEGDGVAAKAGVPEQVSPDELRSFAESEKRAVYWAGPSPELKLELTQTSGGNYFVRYLPEDAQIGDRRPAFTTVATYPSDRPYEVVRRATKRKGANERPVPGGGLALWYDSRPTSVYVAYPDSRQLIEVFAPEAKEARRLAVSGSIAPVR